ncbi:MAG: SPOR domain-containing protein [Bacteroidia bacterium]|nr:SPOR domain-containing protein [Bacteroidia bacterium]
MLSSVIALYAMVFIAVLLSTSLVLAGQDIPEYDEISVSLDIKGIGATEMLSVIKGGYIYLPITDLFDFLRIRNIPSAGLDSISGFFINPEAKFYISRVNNRIIYQEKVHDLPQGDLIHTESNLYLRSIHFGGIFGLNCDFNFRSLSVIVNSELELPLIKEMKQEEMRRNLTRLKGESIADKTIGRSYPKFRFGMADWSAIGTEEINGTSETRLNLALGAVIAGGETNVSLNYNSRDPFTEKQQNYLWRYVNNDFKSLRQIIAGKISSQATSSIFNPVIGVQLTNTPTTYRRSFGSYTLSDKTEPGWIVELYVNNVLVDYVKADASGFFTFQVPLVYGNTIVKLKFYGPWGEERSKEQNINIPFNFLPEKTIEYNVSAGVVEDTLWSRFSRASVNYGLSRGITVGGGVEYLSSVSSGPVMPFVKASFRLANNILLFGEYTYSVRAKGALTYRTPSNIQFDINYAWYHKDQTAINFNYREERKISASVPFKIGKFSSFNRFSVNQLVLPLSQYTTGEWLFSGSLPGVNTNITTYGIFIGEVKPYFYSNIALSARLPGRFVLMPQVQYGISRNELLSAKLKVEKYIKDHAFMSLSYERNFSYNVNMAELGIRYDFNFARTGMSVRQSGKRTTFIENASGSLISDSRTNYISADNRPNVGRGGVTVIPFFDMNVNGIRDKGEKKVPGLAVRANGGRIMYVEKDTTIRILGLEPYTSCFIEMDPGNFENISWQLPYSTLSVTTDANMLKTIEVPVTIAGEANGTVSFEKGGQKRGQERIIVNFYNDKMISAGRVLTESDGYYSLFGLNPGKYLVRVDTSQLRKLGMTSDPDSILFTIKGRLDGDIVDRLDFNLKKIIAETEEIVVPQPVVKKDTSYLIVHEVVEEMVTISEDCWAIQLGAFKKKQNAESLRKKLEQILGQKLEIVVADDFYKVRSSDIRTRAEVDDKIKILGRNGINELWVILLKAKQQQRVLIEKSDSVAVIRDLVDSIIVQPAASPLMSIQVGAFRSNGYAQALKNKISAAVTNPVKVVFEDDYYKVRIAGFTSKADIERLLPLLGMMGMKDLWIPPVKAPEPVIKPAVIPVDTVKKAPAETNKKEQVVQPKIKPAEEPPVTVPPVSMRVGEFVRKSEAVHVQKRILKKLNLESELREQWGYYYIIIGGFYTREETYKYYPELAGLGYTRITVIDLR